MIRECPECGDEFTAPHKKKYCSTKCFHDSRSEKHFEWRCTTCGTKILTARKYCPDCTPYANRGVMKQLRDGITLGELRKYKYWRQKISNHAREVYGELTSCDRCDYNHHVEVCHIVPVSEFSDSALSTEVNSRDNLIGLCPNHHWDLDHDYLEPEPQE